MTLLPHRSLPVLMYHRFGTGPSGDPDLWITPETFRRQLQWLREHGYQTLTLDQAYKRLASNSPSRNEVLLTIDDGFATDLQCAAELLIREEARAAVFVAVDLLGQEVEFPHPSGDTRLTSSGRLVDVAALELWLGHGFDVGSHSLTHVDLTTCSLEILQHELRSSKDRLGDLLQREIKDFCYPFAHHDERTRLEVQKAGYRTGYAGEPPVNDLFSVPRMMVFPRDDMPRFRRKVSGFYFWISALHQKLRGFVAN